MKKITKFDKDNLQALRPELEAALKAFGDKHNIEFTVGRLTYSDSKTTCKLTVAVSGVDERVTEFNRSHARYGFKPEHLGAEFTIGDEKYTLVGFNSNRPKYFVAAKRVRDGKEYSFPERTVQLAFGITEANGRPVVEEYVDRFNWLHKLYGFEKTHLNAEFTLWGEKGILMGISDVSKGVPKGELNPLVVKRVPTGTLHLVPHETVLKAFGLTMPSSKLPIAS